MSDTIYLKHILSGQIEPKQFWLEQLASWHEDEAGNTPEEQFDLILEPVSADEYNEQERELGNSIDNPQRGKMLMSFQPLDKDKAFVVNPFYKNDYQAGPYIKPGTKVSITIDSREQELAILAAYDYGVEALSPEGRYQLNRLIADLKVVITGR